MAIEIRAPIFILGCPRSGTSVFYEKLAQHPDIAVISRATKKVPSSLLATRLLLLGRRNFQPTEAENVWGRFCHGDDHALGPDDATPRARRYLHAVVRTHLALFGKPRFLAKCPRNSVRVGFLNAVFPDAVFVHIVRDGRAVAYSISRSRAKEAGAYWGTRPPGWRGLLGLPVLDASALQWKLITEHALRAAEALPPERYMQLRYEEFTARPVETLNAVAAKCGLAWDPAFLAALVGDIENRNYKWRESLKPEEVARLNELTADLLVRLGYEV